MDGYEIQMERGDRLKAGAITIGSFITVTAVMAGAVQLLEKIAGLLQ